MQAAANKILQYSDKHVLGKNCNVHTMKHMPLKQIQDVIKAFQ